MQRKTDSLGKLQYDVVLFICATLLNLLSITKFTKHTWHVWRHRLETQCVTSSIKSWHFFLMYMWRNAGRIFQYISLNIIIAGSNTTREMLHFHIHSNGANKPPPTPLHDIMDEWNYHPKVDILSYNWLSRIKLLWK